MSNVVPIQLAHASPETREDLQYVGARINELVSTFNDINMSKGVVITSIKFNAVTEKIDVELMTRHAKTLILQY